jgi:ubiquinone/menaquinone biosynthesis C-methylase UbiE
MSEHQNKKFTGVERLRLPERLERLEVGRVLDLCLENGKIHKMLDVGTGSGVFAEAFAGRGLAVAAIDENPAMLEAAKSFIPQADLRQASAEALPFAEGEFDMVFLGLVLHEVDDPAKALQEARRVTRQTVAALEWPYREEEIGPPLAHRLKPEDVSKLAQAAGLGKVEILPLSRLVLYRMPV